MEEKYTPKQVLGFTINILNNINVPVAMVEQIGVPIGKAVGNLIVLMGAVKDEKEGAKDGREADPE